MRPRVYLVLLRAFCEGRVRPDEFETLFMQLFKREDAHLEPAWYDTLNWLFGETDAYVDDPALREVGDNGPEELRAAAVNALELLEMPEH